MQLLLAGWSSFVQHHRVIIFNGAENLNFLLCQRILFVTDSVDNYHSNIRLCSNPFFLACFKINLKTFSNSFTIICISRKGINKVKVCFYVKIDIKLFIERHLKLRFRINSVFPLSAFSSF